jgi:hypothetical protein
MFVVEVYPCAAGFLKYIRPKLFEGQERIEGAQTVSSRGFSCLVFVARCVKFALLRLDGIARLELAGARRGMR